MSAAKKILFICGSLEPGRDGVGDYTRSLAKQCQAHGCECLLIGLTDPFIQQVRSAEQPRVLRIPAALPLEERMRHAEQAATSFAPDLCSWQLVAYAHSPKGILPRELASLAACAPLHADHVMLHELWIGAEEGSSLKSRLIGLLQRRAIRRFLHTHAPRVIHTSNEAYAEMIGRLGFNAEILPLFGNIAVTPDTPADPAPGNARPECVRALLFGTLHPQWDPAEFCTWIVSLGARKRAPVEVVATGRLGSLAPAILNRIRAAGIDVRERGELPATEICRLLRECDFGVATHPWALAGKSGVVAAMVDHGLPVLFPRDDWRLRKAGPGPNADKHRQSDHPLLLRLGDASEKATDRWLRSRRHPDPALPRVAARFLVETGLHRTTHP